jgi:hypothetical protein
MTSLPITLTTALATTEIWQPQEENRATKDLHAHVWICP